MDSFLNVFKRLTQSTTYDRWQPSFTKLVQQVCTRNGGPRNPQGLAVHERIALLRKLDPFIKQPCFVNTDENEMLQAKTDLLMLWEYLLEFVVVMSKTSVKDLGYSLIVQLMQREEFALKRLGFGPNSATPHCSQAHLRLAEKYKALLVQTYMLVMKSMTNKGKYAEIIHFSAQTLVVFFFRLPLVGGSIVDALERKAALQREGKDPDELRLVKQFTPIVDASSSQGADATETKEEDPAATINELGVRLESNEGGEELLLKASGENSNAETSASGREKLSKSKESNGGDAGASATATESSFVEAQAVGNQSDAVGAETAAQLDDIVRNKNKRAAMAAAAAAAKESTTGAFIMENPDLYMWNYFNSEEEARALMRVLTSENACLSWLATKETFFLTFVEMYIVHVETVASHPIEWEVVPAYHLILDCFWPLLRSSMWWDGICKRRVGDGDGWVTSLPAYMRVKRSALALLSNKSLVNPFIKLTFMCCNAHSLLSVDSCVEHLNLWFSTVAYATTAREGISNHNQNSKNTPPKQRLVDDNVKDGGNLSEKQNDDTPRLPSLPANFDYEGYWFGISKLLESDLFQVLLKVLSLLYNTFHLFRGQMRVKFVNDLMHNCFFSLFLHWSAEVRTYFQLTLVYKVLRADRRNLPCFTDAIVIEEYGESQDPPISLRPPQKRFTFGEPSRNGESAAVPPAVYSGESSFERRMAIFDDSSVTDNEELLIDIMHCSKIDSYVRMCLDKDPTIPEERRPYIDASLRQYASLLKQYYKGVSSDSSDSLPLLAHRMVYSDSNPYM
mmetsp:Transcript_15008/g.29261  ORF Transcript_15008/g.29261 Transcript_15008/m.29261 type:complete len:792 (+) Transcript_15008:576-2951(+)|eukprot:CAMPEP_0171494728 /NCGR_PEP_ID=MMETSP0958-20121227/5720_1 /TAXON_ID=87120 /ORGANISM="Aurantiochytrium limacinum, Strain ATCCMYA-1381" /LENGTH=791 /DNA_ID=CAMNT_0012028577 /DNA_START=544 /DNA_END=2919 /DNA_ORIENTATION=+